MKFSSLIFSALIFLNIFVWYWALTGGPSEALNVYFLDVGQGDSSLIVLPGGPKILIDGGPDKSVLHELDKALSPTDRYIDLIILSHPQLDHFAGLISVANRYRVGAFIYNGRPGEMLAWRDLEKVLNEEKIPVVILSAGDKITYKENAMEILSPDDDLIKRAELNETTIIVKLVSSGIKTLFTGDINFDTESKLVDKFDVDVDVLKVAHHGSKYSSGLEFLEEATPLISVIQVGKNKYGHPTETAMNRLAQVGSSIYRNDEQGTIHMKAEDGLINVFIGNGELLSAQNK